MSAANETGNGAEAGNGAGGRPKAAQPCAICGKPQVQTYRPFCSKRCADVDLGRWLGGRYAIAGEPAEVSDEQARAPDPDKADEGADEG